MRHIQFVLALAVVCAFSLAGHAQSTYTCDHYQFFGPTNTVGDLIPYAFAVNDSDFVVGWFLDGGQGEYGFYSQAGTSFHPFKVQGSSSTYLKSVSNAGEMVGWYFVPSDNEWHGFKTSAGGPPITTVDYPGAVQTYAQGINDQGQIVGAYVLESGPQPGFLLSNGQFTTLSVEGASETFPRAINDSGTVVGSFSVPSYAYPFIYSDGNYTLPTAPPTAQLTLFTGINNQGQIAGYYVDLSVSPAVYVAFVYVDGIYNPISIPNATQLQLGGINDKGDITGTIMTPAGDQPAFLGTSCHF
jgi:uncharacterized membrane protein